ncbi:MAG: rRNA maturation RNase YbeY, partial [Chloroflexota bacterium]
MSFALTTDEHLRELHHRFMGIDEETDVMTFPLDEDGEHGGDIVISVDRAEEQAAETGHGLSDEIRFLAVHGLLHLCGWG